MPYLLTTATKKLARLKQRVRGVAGGTSAGKTISILQLLIDDAQTDTSPTLTSVVAESFPHLRKGAIRDFLSIMQEHNYFDPNRWNKTEHTYSFETGSRIEFFSADMPSKVRGPRRDRLFINEANNTPYEAYDQLLVRTKDYCWLDWNPTSEFWFYTDVLPRRGDVDFIKLTYKDNEGLSPNIVKDIESHKENKAWWSVYGLGELGDVEGKIFKDWQIIDEVPHEARLEAFGLDFGFSIDPTAIVAIYYYNGGYIIREIAYQKGLFNNQIATIIKNQDKTVMTVADNAESKSIAELQQYGLAVIPAQKGPGSINRGIKLVQSLRMSVTKDSLNVIKEYRNYMWKTDMAGKITTTADGGFDHSMDAIRYALSVLRVTDEVPEPEKPRQEQIRESLLARTRTADTDDDGLFE